MGTVRKLALSLLTAAALAAGTSLPAGSTSVAAPTAAPVAARAPSPGVAAHARRLAVAVARSGSPAGRQRALTSLLHAVGVATLTSAGTPSGRATPGQLGAALYTDEVRSLSSGYATKTLWTLDQLAGTLTAAGALDTHRAAWTADRVAGVIRSAVRGPAARSSLLGALLVDLGTARRFHPDDLRKASAARTRLDAVQVLLTLLDTAGAFEHAGHAPAVNAAATIDRTARGGCDSEAAKVVGHGLSFGPKVLERDGWAKDVKQALKVGKLLASAAHAASVLPHLHYSWDIPDAARTHYGHESPGSSLTYSLTITFDERRDPRVIRCSHLLWGLKIPKEGPVPDIRVFFVHGDLDSHGSVACVPSSCTTGGDGKVSLRFQPKSELLPYGLGPEHSESGAVLAQPLPLQSLGNTELAPADVGLLRRLPWTVTWHAPTPARLRLSVRSHPAPIDGPTGDDCAYGSYYLTDVEDTTVTMDVPLHRDGIYYVGEGALSKSGSVHERLTCGSAGVQDYTLLGSSDGTEKAFLLWDADKNVPITLDVRTLSALVEHWKYDWVYIDESGTDYYDAPVDFDGSPGFSIMEGGWSSGAADPNVLARYDVEYGALTVHVEVLAQ